MKMIKRFALFLALLIAFSLPAFASVDVQSGGSSVCTAEHIDYSTGTSATCDGSTATVIASLSPSVTTLTASTSVTTATVIASQYVRLPYFSKLTRPASGAPVGSTISMKSSGEQDCGTTNTGANTTYVICSSDGTNWKSINS